MLQAGSEAHRNSDWLMMIGDKSPSRTSCLALCPRTGAKALNTLKLVLAAFSSPFLPIAIRDADEKAVSSATAGRRRSCPNTEYQSKIAEQVLPVANSSDPMMV
jgi:hypothetical protein